MINDSASEDDGGEEYEPTTGEDESILEEVPPQIRPRNARGIRNNSNRRGNVSRIRNRVSIENEAENWKKFEGELKKALHNKMPVSINPKKILQAQGKVMGISPYIEQRWINQANGKFFYDREGLMQMLDTSVLQRPYRNSKDMSVIIKMSGHMVTKSRNLQIFIEYEYKR